MTLWEEWPAGEVDFEFLSDVWERESVRRVYVRKRQSQTNGVDRLWLETDRAFHELRLVNRGANTYWHRVDHQRKRDRREGLDQLYGLPFDDVSKWTSLEEWGDRAQSEALGVPELAQGDYGPEDLEEATWSHHPNARCYTHGGHPPGESGR